MQGCDMYWIRKINWPKSDALRPLEIVNAVVQIYGNKGYKDYEINFMHIHAQRCTHTHLHTDFVETGCVEGGF